MDHNPSNSVEYHEYSDELEFFDGIELDDIADDTLLNNLQNELADKIKMLNTYINKSSTNDLMTEQIPLSFKPGPVDILLLTHEIEQSGANSIITSLKKIPRPKFILHTKSPDSLDYTCMYHHGIPLCLTIKTKLDVQDSEQTALTHILSEIVKQIGIEKRTTFIKPLKHITLTTNKLIKAKIF